MCGDPNSVLRFAFIEFTDEGKWLNDNWTGLGQFVHWLTYCTIAEGARAALNLSGTVLGYYPVRVLPSKTAIAPVNPTFLPRVSYSFGIHIYVQVLLFILIYIWMYTWWLKSASSLSPVWWWAWDVCKDHLLHKHRQEGLLAYRCTLYLYTLCTDVSILFDALGAGLSGRCETVLRVNMWRGWWLVTSNFLSLL